MKNKIAIIFFILITMLLTGCAKSDKKKEMESEIINPFSPTSMVKTYDTSKNKINTAVQKENDNINKALKESGLQ